MSATDKALRSGELARLAGVSSDTLRHYEQIGVLPKSPRTPSGYRMYPQHAAERVRLVQRSLQLGFTLAELAEILQARDRGDVPCHRVLKMTEEKLHSLDRQIQALRRTERYMRQLVRQWRLQLRRTPPGKKAMLLHSLTDQPILPAKGGMRNFKTREQR